jgi:hypothetical protein
LSPLGQAKGFDLFTSADTQKATCKGLRDLRRKLHGLEVGLHSAAQKERAARDSLKTATGALRDVGADPKLKQLCEQRQRKLDTVRSEQQELRKQHRAMEENILRQERCIAQSEFLNFLRSRRYSLNPLTIANALAGVPALAWRTSATRCQKIPAEGFPHFEYRMFLRVQKALANPPREADQAVSQVRNHLLKISPKKDSTVDYLRETFYYLRCAIESTYQTKPPRNALPYLIFSEFQRRQSSRSRYDQVMEEEERL